PGPSSLNRPHPPLSRAHRNFAAQRFICGAFAVRERLSNPREVPGFRCTFLPGMPSPETPRSSTSSVPDSDADIGLRQAWTGSALPISLQSVSRGVNVFGASTVRTFVTACQFARPPSRPGELHPEPLTDPDMKLSPHPARATPRKPCRASPRQEFLRFPVDSILTWWPAPFAPRALPRFLTTTRQCAPDLCIRTFRPVGHPLAQFPLTSPTRFSRSVRKPR